MNTVAAIRDRGIFGLNNFFFLLAVCVDGYEE